MEAALLKHVPFLLSRGKSSSLSCPLCSCNTRIKRSFSALIKSVSLFKGNSGQAITLGPVSTGMQDICMCRTYACAHVCVLPALTCHGE